MKKVYTKPAIMFEAFTLSTNIAACQNEAVFADNVANGCKGYLDEQFGVVIFTSEATGCQYTPGQINDQLCYDVPTISLNLFGS